VCLSVLSDPLLGSARGPFFGFVRKRLGAHEPRSARFVRCGLRSSPNFTSPFPTVRQLGVGGAKRRRLGGARIASMPRWGGICARAVMRRSMSRLLRDTCRVPHRARLPFLSSAFAFRFHTEEGGWWLSPRVSRGSCATRTALSSFTV